MANKIIDIKRLETLLQSHWSEFIDKLQLMRVVLEYARDAEYPVKRSDDLTRQTKLTITKFAIKPLEYEVWVEFTAPKGDGVVIGTHLLVVSLNGTIELDETYGTHFLPETP
jgi:hypothetical protein